MVINVLYEGICYLEEISRTTRIVDIKMKFEEKFNVSWVKLDLTYNGVLLLDELTVQDCQIPLGVELELILKIRVGINTHHQLYSLSVPDYETVGYLKQLLHTLSGVDVENKRLYFSEDCKLDERA
ncbi:hypothetical protein FCV25MIE_32201 [Fagus crenata]